MVGVQPFHLADGSAVDLNSADFDAVACIDALLGDGAVPHSLTYRAYGGKTARRGCLEE